MTKSKLIGPFSQILTLRQLQIKGPLADDQIGIIEKGGVLVKDGRILAVDSFESLAKSADEIEEKNGLQVLLPGFVDCHTHMVWGGNRAQDYAMRMRGETYESVLAAGGGIFESVEKTRATDQEVLLQDFIRRVIGHEQKGVTTIEVKSGYGLDVKNEIKMLEVINLARSKVSAELLSTCLAAHVCPKEFIDKSEYLNYLLAELLPEVKRKGLATRVDAFVEPGAFSADLARDYLMASKDLGFDLTIHADQFTTGGTDLAVEVGARSADHLEASGDKEIQLLSASEVIPVALPGASLGLGVQFMPARKLLNVGCSLAIATDWNPGSAPMGDLLTQAALLGIFEKLSSAEIFAGITYRAAMALGLSDRGRIVEGQAADLVAFPTADYRDILYHQGQMKPNGVWKKGEALHVL